ncbi:hypothetical protein G3I59_27340 [Amycolatopsis rubida]|uniref:Uncharacterized protein n=1 Tax=Amycolatopsis rubida TaxID=112413 RepID=A0ABX0C2C3_9PSEU|nr:MULTISPECIES: hypothetical protein [Amycolatopsis]MYW94212.1 hypothetical protein [Amycolatopsis rubida]NEC59201.1 hypothetical protein [Amycolatopsis rubida]OAP20854.1 hypothetical protein A4R44_08299 [Amycolatopsis sp. M39]
MDRDERRCLRRIERDLVAADGAWCTRCSVTCAARPLGGVPSAVEP